MLVEVASTPPAPLEMLSTVLSPVMQPLATAGIVFVVLLFVLMQREDLRDRMIRLAGSRDLHRTTVAIDDAARRLSRYFVVQLALNASFGVVIGVGLYVIGVPNPVLWAIFAAVMRFVPYLGAFLAAILPMALAAAVDPGWNMMIAVAILFIVLEPLTGQVFEPIFYGQSTGLSPFAVLVSALFWTWLWGPVGLLLSTPLTVCLVVLGRYVDHLEFLDVLFGDRPALTPVQNFYQRILAGDPEEVLGHAELILQQCALSSYYDDVVLKALELAARDSARGVLTAGQKAAMRTALGELIADLSDRSDAVTEAAGEGPRASAARYRWDRRRRPCPKPGRARARCSVSPGAASSTRPPPPFWPRSSRSAGSASARSRSPRRHRPGSPGSSRDRRGWSASSLWRSTGNRPICAGLSDV
ncbi:AI-2E family transporter [Methylobacterium sp. P31]